MKYILILIVIIGLVTYIFLGGGKAVSGQVGPQIDRREEVWERIAFLEAQRREMLTRAKGRLGSGSSRSRLTSTGVYAAGFRDGFNEGYFEAASCRPGPDPIRCFSRYPIHNRAHAL